MGANAWRMSHNPPNPGLSADDPCCQCNSLSLELLDFTDQLGMLVWDENRNFADVPQYYDDLASMILRDRNHPSIIMWSLCNEVGCMQGIVEKILQIKLVFFFRRSKWTSCRRKVQASYSSVRSNQACHSCNGWGLGNWIVLCSRCTGS